MKGGIGKASKKNLQRWARVDGTGGRAHSSDPGTSLSPDPKDGPKLGPLSNYATTKHPRYLDP